MKKTVVFLWFFLSIFIFIMLPRTVFAQSCSTITPPTNLIPNTTTSPGQQVITWDSVPGSSQYLLRIHDIATGDWNGSAVCNGVKGTEVCIGTGNTSYAYNFQPNHQYQIWVHAENSCGSISDPAINNVTVNTLTTTPPSPYVPTDPQYYYVSPQGEDNNPGTLSQPWKTITHARDVVRTKNQNMTGDIVVYLRGGYYTLPSTLTFDQGDSGTNNFNVVYKNYQSEIPLLSGGKQITGWQQDGNRWKAYVGTNFQTRQLYVNGIRATRTRSTTGLPGAVKTNTGYTTTDTSMQNWQNQSDIEFVANVYWKQFRCGVQSISGTTITMKQPCLTNSQAHEPNFNMNTPTWIENAFELLDQPGEWYFNRTTGWIYYMPRANEDMTKSVVIVPILDVLMRGQGSSDSPIHNIVFSGLIFSYATWLRPNTNDGFTPVQGDYSLTGGPWNSLGDSTDWTKTPANISFNNAQHILFEQNIFVHLGAAGFILENGSKNNTIVGNHFTDISASAIDLGDVNNPNTTDSRQITQNNLIANNYIDNVGAEYQGSAGIQVGYTQGTSIAHNDINNLPYSGVSIGWGWGRSDPTVAQNNSIHHNYIHDYAKVLKDAGGIYSLASQPGNIYSDNYITGQVNPFAGIYLDDNSRFITVQNNISINNARSALFKGGDHNIHDNWWQDRGQTRFPGWDYDIPDIWWLTGPSFGVTTCCGQNRIENNHVISNLSEAPASIVENAGLESAYQNIKTLPTLPSPSSTPLSGDINGDNKVDIFDYNLLVTDFGKTDSPGFSPADLDTNGKVDIFDYNILVTNFGKAL